MILGCTHYPLLRPVIQNVMGSHVTLIDSGAETVGEVSMLSIILTLPTRLKRLHSPMNFIQLVLQKCLKRLQAVGLV